VIKAVQLTPKIKWIHEQTNSNSESCAVNFFVHCGSSSEKKNQHGIVHLIEHLVLKGTTSLNVREIYRQVEEHGGELNAYTERDLSCFHINSIKSEFVNSISLLFKCVFDNHYSEQDFESEKSVILQEISGYQDQSDDYFFDRELEVLWPNTSLSRRVAGTHESVKKISKNTVEKFYQNTFLNSPMVISTAGNFAFTKLQVEIKKIISQDYKYKSQISSKKITPKEYGTYPKNWAKNTLIEKKKMDQVYVGIYYPGYSIFSKNKKYLDILSILLGGYADSPLYQALREQSGYCYYMQTTNLGFRDAGLFSVNFTTDKTNYQKALNETFKVIKEFEIVKSNLDFIKKSLFGSYLLGTESSFSKADFNGRNTVWGLKILTNSEYKKLLDKISTKHVANELTKIAACQPCMYSLGDL